MMKTKKLFATALAVATLCGCSQSEVIEQSDSQSAISFSSYLGKSRASVVDNDALKAGEGFYVLGYSTVKNSWEEATAGNAVPTVNFMDNENVKWNATNTEWAYTNIKYWPNSYDGENLGKVSFFAYAPKNDNIKAPILNEAKTPDVTVTTPADVNDQVDFIAASVLDQTKTTADGKVKFTFNHALTKIGFCVNIAKNYENAIISINSIKVNYGAELLKTSTYNLADDEWTLSEKEDDKFAGESTTIFETNDLNGTVPLMTEEEKNAYRTIKWKDGKSEDFTNADDRYLMLIPQENTDKLSVTINYDVYDIKRESTVTNNVKVPLTAIVNGWKKGKQYTYKLAIKLTDVVFEGTIESGWENGTQPDDTQL